MEGRKKNLIPLFHSEDEVMEEESELFTESYDSSNYYETFIPVNVPKSNATIGKSTDTPEHPVESNFDSTGSNQKRPDTCIIPDFANRLTPTTAKSSDSHATRGENTPPKIYAPAMLPIAMDVRPGCDSEIVPSSGLQNLEKDELTRLIDDRIRRLFSPEPVTPKENEESIGECNSIFSKESEFPEFKGDDWNEFILTMSSKLGIECSNSERRQEEKSYMTSRLLPPKELQSVDIPLDGAIIKALKDVDSEWMSKQKIQCCRAKDRKKYSVTQSHSETFCTPPILDENIEEGIMHRNKLATYSFTSKSAETTNNCLRKLDNGARLLLRQISYGALITSYLDELESEDNRQVAIKNLSDLFLSMADVTARIAISSVTARRSLYLKDMDFRNKATENKLLNMSALGPNIFGGKFFDILHGSAENLRSARETQHVRFRAPTSLKRSRDTSSETKEDNYPLQSVKKARCETSVPFRGKKDFQPAPQRGRPEFRRSRASRGYGFRPNSQ